MIIFIITYTTFRDLRGKKIITEMQKTLAKSESSTIPASKLRA